MTESMESIGRPAGETRRIRPVYVQEIDTACLDDVCVLDLGRVVRELDISCENVKHENIILYLIPRHALESDTDVRTRSANYTH